MNVLISGASGFVGREVVKQLSNKGYTTLLLTRNSTTWSPEDGVCNLDKLAKAKIDAVIHLSGESVFGFWTKRKKARIHRSRINGTTALVQAVLKLEHKPSVILCASGSGAYGSRGDDVISEQSEFGDMFLSLLAKDISNAVLPAENAGIRVVHLILGTVLGKDGGALKKSLPMFKLGLGAWFGKGTQWWPWISLTDAARATIHCLENTTINGNVHVCTPNPVRNREYSKTLGQAVSRPVFIKTPAFILNTLLSKGFADEILLNSVRLEPEKLKSTNFVWEHPNLRQALDKILHT